MRKLILALLAVFMLNTTAFAQTTKKENPPLIQLEFGRKSMNCGGFGICVFRINLTAEDVVSIATALWGPGGIFKLSMSPQFYKDNSSAFQNGYLVIDEPFRIDLETTRALGAPDGFTIQKGKYKVVFDKTTNTYNCTF